MGSTVIENYEPSDEGWGVVVGRFAPRPVEDADSSAPADQPPADEEQSASS